MIKNKAIILLFIFLNSKNVFATYDITKDIKIDKEKFSLKWTRKNKNRKVEDKDKINRDKPDYEKYLSYYFDGEKCQGYDFDPNMIETINLIGFDQEDNQRNVVLKNGKRFIINNSTDNCPNIILKGKDSYKQLPDGCRFTIGMYCVSPPPTNCKNINGSSCMDKDVKQDGESFIYEFTNNGIEHLRGTTIMEYDNIDGE